MSVMFYLIPNIDIREIITNCLTTKSQLCLPNYLIIILFIGLYYVYSIDIKDINLSKNMLNVFRPISTNNNYENCIKLFLYINFLYHTILVTT